MALSRKTLLRTDIDWIALNMDYQNGNFDIKTDNIEDYTFENIVQESIRNGQMKQAREQCDEYGLD